MTTALAAPSERLETPTSEAASFQLLDHDRIEPSPLNPRKHFNQEKLVELAQSFGGGVGIIEPLVVRATPGGRFEMIAGERRWRAAGLAGLEQVPVIVRDLTDAQVLEIMVIENNQREDINPLEEADGFSRLLSNGYELASGWAPGSVEEIHLRPREAARPGAAGEAAAARREAHCPARDPDRAAETGAAGESDQPC